MEGTNETVYAAVRGGGLLILLAFLQRGSTFMLNLFLQRSMVGTDSLQIYGAASITLELLLSAILFISREPFRLAIARAKVTQIGTDEIKCLVNFTWISVLLGIIVTFFIWNLYSSYISAGVLAIERMNYAAGLICLSALLELLCEPFFLIYQFRLKMAKRVRSEATAVLALGLAKYILTVYTDLEIVAFGFAQLIYSLVLIVMYGKCISSEIVLQKSMNKKKFEENVNLDEYFQSWTAWFPSRVWSTSTTEQVYLTGLLTGQSIFKHLLTEGDKIVLSRAGRSSLYEQGVYAIAHNYGSLVARLILQPIEESARLMFGQLDGKTKISKDTVSLEDLLSILLKGVILIGLVFASLGFHYTSVLLTILMAGKKDKNTDALKSLFAVSDVLRWYCMYIPCLAVNGICEAFVFAVAGKSHVLGLSGSLFGCFLIFNVLCGPFMHRYGTKGLVMTNSIGMLFRIGYCIWWICKYFKSPRPILNAFPHPYLILSFVLVFYITGISEEMSERSGHPFFSLVCHVSIGIFGLFFLLTVFWFTEKPLRLQLGSIFRKNKAL